MLTRKDNIYRARSKRFLTDFSLTDVLITSHRLSQIKLSSLTSLVYILCYHRAHNIVRAASWQQLHSEAAQACFWGPLSQWEKLQIQTFCCGSWRLLAALGRWQQTCQPMGGCRQRRSIRICKSRWLARVSCYHRLGTKRTSAGGSLSGFSTREITHNIPVLI